MEHVKTALSVHAAADRRAHTFNNPCIQCKLNGYATYERFCSDAATGRMSSGMQSGENERAVFR